MLLNTHVRIIIDRYLLNNFNAQFLLYSSGVTRRGGGVVVVISPPESLFFLQFCSYYRLHTFCVRYNDAILSLCL